MIIYPKQNKNQNKIIYLLLIFISIYYIKIKTEN